MSENTISDDDLSLGVQKGDRIADASGHIPIGAVNGKQSLKSIFSPANRTRLIASTAAAVMLVSVLAYVSMGVKREDVVAAGGAGQVKSARVSADSNTEPSKLQQEEADRYNENLARRQAEGETGGHPVILTGVNPFEPVSQTTTPDKISDVGRAEQVQAGTSQQQGQQRAQAQQNLAAMDDFLKDLIKAEGEQRPGLYSVEWSYSQPGASRGQDAAAATKVANYDESTTGQASSRCASPLLRAGSMLMATTDLALNSDVGGPVALTIRSGRLRGSQLIGKFERKEEWLRMELDRMVTPSATLSVEAIGLDMETTLNAVEGDVDNHIMYRYGWWGIGTALSAIGKAAESNVDKDVFVSDGAIVESTASNSQREIKIALGELGQDLGEVMRDRINRPITVSLKVNDEVGVFFMEDVCENKAY